MLVAASLLIGLRVRALRAPRFVDDAVAVESVRPARVTDLR